VGSQIATKQGDGVDNELEARLREMLAENDIRKRLMGYLRGIDRNDGELVQDTFWPEALVDHGHSAFRGDTIGDFFGTVSTHATRNQVHHTANLVIEVHGDEGISEGQSLYFAETDRNDVTYLIFRSIRYIDRWEQRNGEWRIFHRTVVENFNSLSPVVEHYPNSEGIIYARPDKSDISYHLFELARNNEREDLVMPDNEENWKHARERLDSAGFGLRK
jgi:hypothetical protein